MLCEEVCQEQPSQTFLPLPMEVSQNSICPSYMSCSLMQSDILYSVLLNKNADHDPLT